MGFGFQGDREAFRAHPEPRAGSPGNSTGGPARELDGTHSTEFHSSRAPSLATSSESDRLMSIARNHIPANINITGTTAPSSVEPICVNIQDWISAGLSAHSMFNSHALK